jgi:hypothetical protein
MYLILKSETQHGAQRELVAWCGGGCWRRVCGAGVCTSIGRIFLAWMWVWCKQGKRFYEAPRGLRV